MRPVPMHPGDADRERVVRAKSSVVEHEFFERLSGKLKAPTMADLLRYLAAEKGLELGLKLPETWRPYYDKK